MEKKYNSENDILINNPLNLLLNVQEYNNNIKNNEVISSSQKNILDKKNLNNNRLNPNNLILDALKIVEKLKSKKYLENRNNLEISEIIEDTKIRARTSYINNKTEKSKMEIKEQFSKALKSINKKVLNNLENNFHEIINIKNSYIEIMKENEMLDYELSNINKDVRILNKKLFNLNDEISKWQIKFNPFKKVMPFFEGLIRLFPNEEPKNLIINFFENKQKSIEYIHRLNKLEENFFDISNQRDKILHIENEERNHIESRIKEEKKLFETREKILKQEIFLYQSHYDNLQILNANKQKLKLKLIKLYKIIKKYIPHDNYNKFIKKIGYNPIKDEKEFDPSIFDNKYFSELIIECIINKASESNEGKLLRNTIVFTNYLSRKYLIENKKNNYRYEPVKTFRELKNYIDNLNFENNSLKALLINLKQKQSDLKYKRKNLEYILKKSKIEYKELLLKLEKAKKIQLDLFKSKNNINKNIENTKEYKLIKSKSNNNLKFKINNKDNLFNTIEYYNNSKTSKLFITHTNKIKEKKKNINKENKIIIENEKINKKTGKELKEIIKNFKTIKNIKISNNKDKLYKTNGFNSTGNLFLQTQKILKEIYENEKIFKNPKSNKIKTDKLTIETSEEFPSLIYNRKKHQKEDKFKTEESKRPFSSILIKENNYKMISNKIINNIDNIIDTLNGLKMEDIKIDEKTVISSSSNRFTIK